jgi:hypothetical protein
MKKQFDTSIKKVEHQPFHNLTQTNIDEFPFKVSSSWLIPQALAYATSNMTLARGSSGLIDPTATLNKLREKYNPEQLKWFIGLLMYLNYSPRGSILGINSTPQRVFPEYSCMTPLILAAFKRERGIKYSEWDFSDKHINKFIDRDLLEVIQCAWTTADRQQLLGWREQAITINKGINAGSYNNPVDVYKNIRVKDDVFDSMPRLAKLMALQLYVAHPSVRKDYMILSQDFTMPEILIDDNIVQPIKTIIEKDKEWELPWD